MVSLVCEVFPDFDLMNPKYSGRMKILRLCEEKKIAKGPKGTEQDKLQPEPRSKRIKETQLKEQRVGIEPAATTV